MCAGACACIRESSSSKTRRIPASIDGEVFFLILEKLFSCIFWSTNFRLVSFSQLRDANPCSSRTSGFRPSRGRRGSAILRYSFGSLNLVFPFFPRFRYFFLLLFCKYVTPGEISLSLSLSLFFSLSFCVRVFRSVCRSGGACHLRDSRVCLSFLTFFRPVGHCSFIE